MKFKLINLILSTKISFQHVLENMELSCHCHGTSGSCSMKTCFRKVPKMRTLGNILKKQYLNAVKVIKDNASPLENRVFRNIRDTAESNPVPQRRFRGARETSGMVLSNSGLLDFSTLAKPMPQRLVYYESQGDDLFCNPDSNFDILGTKGRQCNSTSPYNDNCGNLCCNRGHSTHHYYKLEACNCKFVWCCRVECQECLNLHQMETCL